MTKTTTNLGVAKLWAQGRDHEAKSNNGNLWCEGRTLYSYRTPIAYLMPNGRGHLVPLITAHSYSVTTEGKHKGAAHKATSYTAFVVPFFGIGNTGRHSPDTLDRTEAHNGNVAYLLDQFTEEAKRLKAARVHRSFDTLERKAATLLRYVTTFGLPTYTAPLEETKAALEAHWARKAV